MRISIRIKITISIRIKTRIRIRITIKIRIRIRITIKIRIRTSGRQLRPVSNTRRAKASCSFPDLNPNPGPHMTIMHDRVTIYVGSTPTQGLI